MNVYEQLSVTNGTRRTPTLNVTEDRERARQMSRGFNNLIVLTQNSSGVNNISCPLHFY